jgi:hypothetical protein
MTNLKDTVAAGAFRLALYLGFVPSERARPISSYFSALGHNRKRSPPDLSCVPDHTSFIIIVSLIMYCVGLNKHQSINQSIINDSVYQA